MKSNRTAVKALRSGCGKCSERGLGPCADGIAAAKKKMEARGPGGRRRVIRADCRGDLGRTVAGTCAGLPRGLPSGDAAVSTGVVLRLRGPGGRWSGGASGVSGGCGNLCRVAAGASERWRRGVNRTSCCVCGVRAGEKWEPGCEAAFSGRQPRVRGCFRTAGLRVCTVGVA